MPGQAQNRCHFTNGWIKSLSPPNTPGRSPLARLETAWYYDDDVNFLALAVRSSGTKTFFYARRRGKKTGSVKIARWGFGSDKLRGEMSVDEARDAARKMDHER